MIATAEKNVDIKLTTAAMTEKYTIVLINSANQISYNSRRIDYYF